MIRPKTGLGFVRPLAFIMVLGVLLWLLLCSLCAVVFVVCRRRCYIIATEMISCFGSRSIVPFFEVVQPFRSCAFELPEALFCLHVFMFDCLWLLALVSILVSVFCTWLLVFGLFGLQMASY